MSDILDKIRKDYIEFSQRNKYIQDLIKKLEKGTATLKEVDAITKATGHALKVAITKNVPENATAFANEETLIEILNGTFQDNYDMINEIAESVQKNLDKKQGINIKPQKADFPKERIENLAKFTAEKDLAESTSLNELGASIENINNSMFTDYVKANAEFRSRAGLKVYVIRSDGAGCCEWCSNLVGKYVYPDVPKDVWRRHKRCSCEITYVNEKAGTYDRISYSDRKDGENLVSNKQVTRLTPEQAVAKEKDVLNRLDKRRESGIIKSDIKINMQFFAEKDIEKQESNSLKRAIRNYNKRIKEHEEYIKNPYEHCPEWDNYEERKKNGLIRHWEKEISNFEKSIEDRIKELKKRGDYDE